MENSTSLAKRLQDLNWHDFSVYPKRGADVVIRAKGFDTAERVWRHVVVIVPDFNPFEFPQKQIIENTAMFHAKWTYQWLLMEEIENVCSTETGFDRLLG